jgi:hypothetical protein
VLVGVDEHLGFGPGIVTCSSTRQAGATQVGLGGGHFGGVRLVVAVKHGQQSSAIALAQTVRFKSGQFTSIA